MKVWRDAYNVHISVTNGEETLEFIGNTERETKETLKEFFEEMSIYDRRDFH